MKIHQLSLFLENRTGKLSGPVMALSKAGINIQTLCLADSQQFGILRLILKDWEKAQDILRSEGYTVTVTEVLALDVADRPGGLGEILQILEAEHLAVEYMYAFSNGPHQNQATLIFRFESPDLALAALERQKIDVISPLDLFGRSA